MARPFSAQRRPAACRRGNTTSRNARISASGPTKVWSGIKYRFRTPSLVISAIRSAQYSGVPISPSASESWATTSSGTNDVARMRCLPVVRVREIGIDLMHRLGDVELRQADPGRLDPVTAPAKDAPVNGGRPSEAASFFEARGCRGPYGPGDLEVFEAPAAAPGAALQVRERSLDDALVEPHHEEHTVGDLAGDLDRFRTGRRHQHGDRSSRRIGEAAGRPVPVDGLAGEERFHGGDAGPHLGERGGLLPDGARRRVAGPDHELHASRRQLLDSLDRAGQHRRMARDRVRDRREQREPRRAAGCLSEDHEGVPAQHLAVEDAGAVEPGRLDVLEQGHQLGHWSCAGHA